MAYKILAAGTVLLLAVVAIQLVSSRDVNEHKKVKIVNENHNMTLGRRLRGDKLLQYAEVKVDRRWLWYVSYDFVFPNSTNVTDRTPYITFINVRDQVPNDQGGYPYLVAGGPGHRNVTVHLKSRWNRGIDFRITVYGR